MPARICPMDEKMAGWQDGGKDVQGAGGRRYIWRIVPGSIRCLEIRLIWIYPCIQYGSYYLEHRAWVN